MTAAELEAGALAVLQTLVQTFGGQLVMAVFGAMTAPEVQILEDGSLFVAGVLGAIRGQVADAQIAALLNAQYIAADAAVDAVENAKFTKP